MLLNGNLLLFPFIQNLHKALTADRIISLHVHCWPVFKSYAAASRALWPPYPREDCFGGDVPTWSLKFTF
jgi:hypothetical protein